MSISSEMPMIHAQDVPSLGWRTASDQEQLYKQRVAILGVGGAGGGVAESVAREGMSVTLADPDSFDITNLNRQNGSYLDNVGRNKAETVAELIRRIRGIDADVRVFDEGVTLENMDDVLKDATLILDAIDISRPDLSIALARKARALALPVFMGIEIGMGCSITCFDPSEQFWTAEHYYGIGNDEIVTSDTEIPIDQMLVHMPSYSPPGMLEAFANGELPSTPGVSPGVQILAGTMTTMLNRWALDRQNTYPQFVYPNLYVLDPIDGMFVLHADERLGHLTQSLGAMGTNMQSSGFSLPADYATMKA